MKTFQEFMEDVASLEHQLRRLEHKNAPHERLKARRIAAAERARAMLKRTTQEEVEMLEQIPSMEPTIQTPKRTVSVHSPTHKTFQRQRVFFGRKEQSDRRRITGVTAE